MPSACEVMPHPLRRLRSSGIRQNAVQGDLGGGLSFIAEW
jgi:hypothetical protein